MIFAHTDEEAFKFLLKRAHQREGATLSPQTLTELERIADNIGISYDNTQNLIDEPVEVREYIGGMSDEELGEVLSQYNEI